MKKILFTLAAALTMVMATMSTQATAAPKGNSGNKGVMPMAKGISNANLLPKTTIPNLNLNKTTNLMLNKTTNLNLNKTTNLNLNKVSNYNLTKATKFSQGFMYKGKNHFHWSIQRWDVRYGCNCFYDPYILAWFYWCEPDLCYYPVTYVPYQTYCCFDVVRPVVATTSCLPCQQGLSSAVGVAGVTASTGVPVEPIEGTQEPPITDGNDVPPIPEPMAPMRKQ